MIISLIYNKSLYNKPVNDFAYQYLIFSSSKRIAIVPARKMKFSIKDFFGKCYQIRSFLRIWSYLLKKSLMENFIFCAVVVRSIISSVNEVITAIVINVQTKQWSITRNWSIFVFIPYLLLVKNITKLQQILKIKKKFEKKIEMLKLILIRKKKQLNY